MGWRRPRSQATPRGPGQSTPERRPRRPVFSSLSHLLMVYETLQHYPLGGGAAIQDADLVVGRDFDGSRECRLATVEGRRVEAVEESRSPGPTCAAGAVLDLIIVGGGSGQGDVGRKASDVDAEAGPRCGAGAPERGPGGGGGGQDTRDPVGVVRAGVDGRVGVHPDRAIIGVGAGGLGRRVLADPEHVEPDVPGGVGSILGTVGLIAHQYAILSARRLSVANDYRAAARRAVTRCRGIGGAEQLPGRRNLEPADGDARHGVVLVDKRGIQRPGDSVRAIASTYAANASEPGPFAEHDRPIAGYSPGICGGSTACAT